MKDEYDTAEKLIFALAGKRKLQIFCGKMFIFFGAIILLFPTISILKNSKVFYDAMPLILLPFGFSLIFIVPGLLMLLEAWVKNKKDSDIYKIKEEFSFQYPEFDFFEAVKDCSSSQYNTKNFYIGKDWAAFYAEKFVLLKITDIVWIYKYISKVNFLTYEIYAVINSSDGVSRRFKTSGMEFNDICDLLNEKNSDVVIGYSRKYEQIYTYSPQLLRKDDNEEEKNKSENLIITGNLALDIFVSAFLFLCKVISKFVKFIFGIKTDVTE